MPTERSTLLGELRAFMTAIVEPRVRLLQSQQPQLEVQTSTGWRPVAPFA